MPLNSIPNMKPPCMVVVQHILPAFRLEITRELVDKYGMRRSDAADKMGVTPAAVTQYLSRARGGSATTLLEGSSKVMELVGELSRDIATGESPLDVLLLKLCRACAATRSEGLICKLHKEAMPGLAEVRDCSCSLNLT
jgi:predicted transcriptional regulator